jgi:uncharacterized protein (TIGR02246 family)
MPAQKPEEVDALFEKYVNESNLDALVDLYEPEATLCIPPGQTSVGTEAIRTALKTMSDIGFRVKCNVTHAFTAGDIAATYNDWTGTAKRPDGNEMSFSGKAIEICHRQPDGTWKFAIDDPYARGGSI